MVKMMMTVVIVFTVCWLPFNVLMLALDNDERLGNWAGLPFVWTALHWLSMSHSCYNPVIYCWMNARFRSGFLAALAKLPGIRRFIPEQRRRAYTTSMAGIALTVGEPCENWIELWFSTTEGISVLFQGIDATENSLLHRVNTCTTYISVRRKPNGNHCAPARSASLRHSELISRTTQPQARRLVRLDSQPEEQI